MRRLSTALVLLLAACFSGYSSDDPSPALRVHRGAFTSDIILTGELEAGRGEAITVPRLPSWQTSIKWIATDGGEVKEGEKVVELDSSAFASNLDSKRQAVVQAEQELTQKQAEWAADLAQKELDAEKKKVDYEKARLDAAVPTEIVSAREYQDRQIKFKRAEVEFVKARDVMRSQRASIAADRANLDVSLAKSQRDVREAEAAIASLTLRAPRSGIVVIRDIPWENRKLQEGDAVWVGFALALIPEPTSMQVSAALADVDDRKISIGMPVTVVLDAYPAMRFPGRVTEISAVAQESARSSLRRAFKVVIKLDRIDFDRMRPGLSVRVTIRRATQRDALLASRAGLDFAGKQPKAHLAGGKTVEVRLGPCNAQECVVVDGLHDGDQLEPVRRSEDLNG
jgi:HlyD family secretion protein